MHTTPQIAAAPDQGTQSPSEQSGTCAAVPHHPDGVDARKEASQEPVGESRHSGSAALNRRCRMERILRDLQAGRQVPDQDLLQHAQDCTDLMNVSYGMFEAGQGEQYRDEAARWKNCAQHARNCLSPEWKAAREAQIQHGIAAGTGCYFLDEADRARRAANEGSRG